jgi:hypothetical protein
LANVVKIAMGWYKSQKHPIKLKYKDQGIFGGKCPPIEVIPLLPIIQRRSMDSLKEVSGTFDPEELRKFRAEYAKKGEKFKEYSIGQREKYLAKTGRKRSHL